MDAKARNDNEMESLKSNEEDETMLGMYLDVLSYRNLISISGSHTRMFTKKHSSDKSSTEICSRFECLINYNFQVLIIISMIKTQRTAQTINQMNQRF